MTSSNWTDSEIAFLKEKYLEMTIQEIADSLKKDFYSVKHKIGSLSLSGKNQKWTDEDVKFLYDNVDMPLKEMSEILGRSVDCIKAKHQRIGLKKYNNYTVMYKEIYHSWLMMKARCCDEKNKNYNDYGGRGITICDNWIDDFTEFCDWSLENGWQKGLSIDRVDNNGNYCPENCRWATKGEQANNRRSNTFMTAHGETKTLINWSRDDRCKVSYNVLVRRFGEAKLSPEEMLSTPQVEAKTLTAWGETKTIKEWLKDERCNGTERTIYKRIKKNTMTNEDIISGGVK